MSLFWESVKQFVGTLAPRIRDKELDVEQFACRSNALLNRVIDYHNRNLPGSNIARLNEEVLIGSKIGWWGQAPDDVKTVMKECSANLRAINAHNQVSIEHNPEHEQVPKVSCWNKDRPNEVRTCKVMNARINIDGRRVGRPHVSTSSNSSPSCPPSVAREAGWGHTAGPIRTNNTCSPRTSNQSFVRTRYQLMDQPAKVRAALKAGLLPVFDTPVYNPTRPCLPGGNALVSSLAARHTPPCSSLSASPSLIEEQRHPDLGNSLYAYSVAPQHSYPIGIAPTATNLEYAKALEPVESLCQSLPVAPHTGPLQGGNRSRLAIERDDSTAYAERHFFDGAFAHTTPRSPPPFDQVESYPSLTNWNTTTHIAPSGHRAHTPAYRPIVNHGFPTVPPMMHGGASCDWTSTVTMLDEPTMEYLYLPVSDAAAPPETPFHTGGISQIPSPTATIGDALDFKGITSLQNGDYAPPAVGFPMLIYGHIYPSGMVDGYNLSHLPIPILNSEAPPTTLSASAPEQWLQSASIPTVTNPQQVFDLPPSIDPSLTFERGPSSSTIQGLGLFNGTHEEDPSKYGYTPQDIMQEVGPFDGTFVKDSFKDVYISRDTVGSDGLPQYDPNPYTPYTDMHSSSSPYMAADEAATGLYDGANLLGYGMGMFDMGGGYGPYSPSVQETWNADTGSSTPETASRSDCTITHQYSSIGKTFSFSRPEADCTPPLLM